MNTEQRGRPPNKGGFFLPSQATKSATDGRKTTYGAMCCERGFPTSEGRFDRLANSVRHDRPNPLTTPTEAPKPTQNTAHHTTDHHRAILTAVPPQGVRIVHQPTNSEPLIASVSDFISLGRYFYMADCVLSPYQPVRAS